MAYSVVVARPEPLGGHDRQTAGQPEKQAERQELQRRRRSDRRQRLRAQHPAHDRGVGDAVAELEDIADQQRQSKAEQQSEGPPAGHILNHAKIFLLAAAPVYRIKSLSLNKEPA